MKWCMYSPNAPSNHPYKVVMMLSLTEIELEVFFRLKAIIFMTIHFSYFT